MLESLSWKDWKVKLHSLVDLALWDQVDLVLDEHHGDVAALVLHLEGEQLNLVPLKRHQEDSRKTPRGPKGDKKKGIFTFFLHFLIASSEARSVVENAKTQAWGENVSVAKTIFGEKIINSFGKNYFWGKNMNFFGNNYFWGDKWGVERTLMTINFPSDCQYLSYASLYLHIPQTDTPQWWM